ncbi:hypothetical protein EMIT093MI4_80173 [Pseudomonas sp. IT-93MI4]
MMLLTVWLLKLLPTLMMTKVIMSRSYSIRLPCFARNGTIRSCSAITLSLSSPSCSRKNCTSVGVGLISIWINLKTGTCGFVTDMARISNMSKKPRHFSEHLLIQAFVPIVMLFYMMHTIWQLEVLKRVSRQIREVRINLLDTSALFLE